MRKVVSIIAGGLLLAPLGAHAGFDIDPAVQKELQPAKPVVAAHPLAMNVTLPSATYTPPLAGAAPIVPVSANAISDPSKAWDEQVTGFGHNEAVAAALKQVVPVGGQLLIHDTIPTAKRVSWDGSQSRIAIARKVMADAGINGRFNGDDLIIESKASEAPVAIPAVIAEITPTNTAVAPVVVAGTNAEPMPQKKVDPGTESRLWTIPKGAMLSDALANWMAETGGWGDRYSWTVLWDARDPLTQEKIDYKIVAPLKFTGTIDQAVVDLVLLYRKAPKPFGIDINREQRVIHIKLRG